MAEDAARAPIAAVWLALARTSRVTSRGGLTSSPSDATDGTLGMTRRRDPAGVDVADRDSARGCVTDVDAGRLAPADSGELGSDEGPPDAWLPRLP